MLETYELLDRYELLFPENRNISDLRRAYIDGELSSIFRLSNADEDFRKSVMEKNLHSLFRLLENDSVNVTLDDLRKAVVEENLHSIFRFLDYEDLRKLIMEDNTWKLFSLLDEYCTTNFTIAFKRLFRENIKFDHDSFSRGQLQSKIWLVKELENLHVDLGTVFLCAGWYATLSVMLFESNMSIEKIRSFDIDKSTVSIAEIFNKPWVMDDWKFKAACQDIHDINYNQFTYIVHRSDGSEAELTDSPDTVVNTSCEHIKDFTEWYNKIPTGKLVVLQTNNYFEVEEHVNCVADTDDFDRMAPMSDTLFLGELKLEKYSRFMKIGYK